MHIRELACATLVVILASANASAQSGVDLIQQWADGWAEVPGSRWTWEFAVPNSSTGESRPVREEVAIYGMEAFVRSSTMEMIIGKGPSTSVGGLDEQGRYFSLPGHSNTFTGGNNVVVDRVGLFRASSQYAPSAIAQFISSGSVPLKSDEVSIDGDTTIWKPAYFEGEYRYSFSERLGVPVLLAIEWLDDAGDVRSTYEYSFAGGRVESGVAIPSESEYTSYPMNVRLPHPNDPTKFIELNETTRRTELLVAFEVLDESMKPYVDPTGRRKYVAKKQAFFDPDGNMILLDVTTRCGRSAKPDTDPQESPDHQP